MGQRGIKSTEITVIKDFYWALSAGRNDDEPLKKCALRRE